MLVTSAIMRRPEGAKPANENDQHFAPATRQGTSLTLSRLLAPELAQTLASTVERQAIQPKLVYARGALVNVAMLGGAFVVPIATLIAVICTWLPQNAPLHRMAPTFFAVATLWFVAALLLSHFQPRNDGGMRREAA
jgi:hypothetical protein